MSRAPMKKVEGAIQKAVIIWCRQQPALELAFHIKNEGKKTIGEAREDKRMGALAGIPDLCVPMSGGKTLWLELKTKKGRLHAAQKKMHDELRLRGHDVRTAYGYKQAIEILQEYVEEAGL